MEKENLIKLLIISIAVFGNVFSLIGFIANFILNLNCKWVWLVSAIGWGLFVATLCDLLKLEEEANK